MDRIAECIYLAATDFEGTKDRVIETVDALVKAHPLYE